MLYLSGKIQPKLVHPKLGWMMTPEMGNRPAEHGYIGIDNGCFSHPERFELTRYLEYVRRIIGLCPGRVLFATTPDVMGDSAATVRQFIETAPAIRKTGVPVALVAQPGLGVEDVPWHDVDAIFLGGGTNWRSGQDAAALVKEARKRGIWVHMGMVNTERRFRAAESMGCDSVDGTFLAFGPDVNWPRLQSWINHPQKSMIIP